MKHIERIAGVEYHKDEKIDISLRVITDHIRSTAMMVCDGVIPSNEGRGYVLRRLLRRAARHGKLLGINRPFLSEVLDTVIAENEGHYPELAQKSDYIHKVIEMEEARFDATIDSGLSILGDMVTAVKAEGKTELPASDAKKEIEGFDAPDVTFSGAPMAEVYTNVYRANIMDMAHGKIEDDGRSHTSTPYTCNFGCYQMCIRDSLKTEQLLCKRDSLLREILERRLSGLLEK